MLAIGVEVRGVVEEVGRYGRSSESHKGDGGGDGRAGEEQRARGCGRRDDQHILEPRPSASISSLRPTGSDGWSRMMRDRADLGLVTHLTLHELSVAKPISWSHPGQVVSICENPQVMQAAVRAAALAPLLCFSGNPASVGTQLFRRLLACGNQVRYHGDFDWPGVAIAGRVIHEGALPWRMAAADYTDAVAGVDADHAVALTGPAVPTAWDPALASAMSTHGVAIHEEFVLPDLVTDLAT